MGAWADPAQLSSHRVHGLGAGVRRAAGALCPQTEYWDVIDVPILVVRGQQSDLLPETVLKDMMCRNRNARVHTVQNCGHAPALIADNQIDAVTKFLNGDDAGAR